MKFDQAIISSTPVSRFFAKLAICVLILLALTTGCGPSREEVRNEVKAGLTAANSYTDAALTRERQQTAQYVGNEITRTKQEIRQEVGGEFTKVRNEMGQDRERIQGQFKVTNDGLTEFREKAEPQLAKIPVIEKGVHQAIHGGSAPATTAPDTSMMVAGEGTAPKPKVSLAASECTEVEDTGVTCINPTADQLRRMKRERRTAGDMHAFGPTQAAVDAAWEKFVRTAEAAGFDLSALTPPTDAKRAKVSSGRPFTGIKIEFSDIPADVKALRKAPKLATP